MTTSTWRAPITGGRAGTAPGAEPGADCDLDQAEPAPPSLRGRIHLWSLLPAAATGTVLITEAAAVSAAAAATAVYTASLLGLFAASAMLHCGSWSMPRTRARLRRLDHAMIFVFIAGTTTPLAVLAVPSSRGIPALIAVWAAALVGTGLSLCWGRAPRRLRVGLYLVVGWAPVVILVDLGRHSGVALVLVVAGGLIYSLGALGFGLRLPRGWPATFGFHEFFHVATVTAAACHHIAIWLVLYG